MQLAAVTDLRGLRRFTSYIDCVKFFSPGTPGCSGWRPCLQPASFDTGLRRSPAITNGALESNSQRLVIRRIPEVDETRGFMPRSVFILTKAHAHRSIT